MTVPSTHDTWDELGIRLRRLCSPGRCKAVVRVSVLVGEDGLPIAWSRPELRPIEPSGTAALDILDSLAYNEDVTSGAHP